MSKRTVEFKNANGANSIVEVQANVWEKGSQRRVYFNFGAGFATLIFDLNSHTWLKVSGTYQAGLEAAFADILGLAPKTQISDQAAEIVEAVKAGEIDFPNFWREAMWRNLGSAKVEEVLFEVAQALSISSSRLPLSRDEDLRDWMKAREA